MKKIITIAALALSLTACGADTSESPDTASETSIETTAEEITTHEANAEETATSTMVDITTVTEVSEPAPDSPADTGQAASAGAPTIAEAMEYQHVETVTSGLNIYQQPGTNNYHLCIMYGEAPGYEFITDTGCSEAMSYDGLFSAIMASWDTAIADLDAPVPPA